MRLAFEEVKKTMQEILIKHGCSQEKAEKVARLSRVVRVAIQLLKEEGGHV